MMTHLAWLLLGTGVAAALALIDQLRRRHEREHAADYVDQIQILKPDQALKLPAIKPLKAKRARRRGSRAEIRRVS